MKKIQLNQGYVGEKNGVKCVLANSPEVQFEIKKRKDLGKAIGYCILAALIVTFIINILILPATGAYARVDGRESDTFENPYIANFYANTPQVPMVSAHRAGGELYPEETWEAFEHCLETGDVDILEFDLHLSKDNKLILLHDHELDRTSDSVQKFGKGKKVKDLTYAQLKTLNMGYNFQDPKTGEYTYRDKQVDILELNVLFDKIEEYLSSPENKSGKTFEDLKFIIEIKDGGKRGNISMDKLYEVMEEREITDRVVVGTFQQSVTDYIDKAYPNEKTGVHRSSGILDVLNFYYSFLYGTEPNNKFDVMELPTGFDGFFDLSTPEFMNYAHKHGVALQYWTINDEETMSRLLKNGADAIITDNPDLAHDVIVSLKNELKK